MIGLALAVEESHRDPIGHVCGNLDLLDAAAEQVGEPLFPDVGVPARAAEAGAAE